MNPRENIRLIDIHCHTTASDGVLPPASLVDLAVESSVEILAVTDHDTIEGIPEALAAGENKPISIIPGIEFSIDSSYVSFHLLGLYIDHTCEPLVKKIKLLTDERNNRAEKIVASLNSYGIHISYDEVLEEAQGGVTGRPHIARVLMKHGIGESVQEIFQNYMVPGRPGYVKKEKISFAEAQSLIEESGGVSVIAHPVTLGLNSDSEFRTILRDMAEAGLSGIEVGSNLHDDYYVDLFTSVADELGLAVVGGSDFHGDKNEKLGFYGDGRSVSSLGLHGVEELRRRSRWRE